MAIVTGGRRRRRHELVKVGLDKGKRDGNNNNGRVGGQSEERYIEWNGFSSAINE